jgi:hypothetical protein
MIFFNKKLKFVYLFCIVHANYYLCTPKIEFIKKRKMKKRIIVSLLASMALLPSVAQVSTTLSPYSQYGLGVLSDQSVGFNRAMGGVAYGLRNGKYVNMQNPASYSAVDSLTMIFDAGVTGQMSNYKEGGKSLNTKTGNFDYAVAAFRLFPRVGLALGVVPYSNIGYAYTHTNAIGSSEAGSTTTATQTYSGDGGFSQFFVGAGWRVTKNLSLGVNVSYFWGKYTKTIQMSTNETGANVETRSYSTSVSNYKLDFGAQWQQPLNDKDLLTIGATVGLGHKLGADADLQILNSNTSNSSSTSSTITVGDALSIPYTFGLGAALLHKASLTAAVDYTLQKWGSEDYPVFNNTNGSYTLQGGYYKDRHKVAAGVDWQPKPLGRKFYQLVHYRMGVSYATPYYKIGTQDGPGEMSVSAGFGIPIYNSWNNRSMLNISAQWVRNTGCDLIKENMFRINIGLTFNERWFAKWKVD